MKKVDLEKKLRKAGCFLKREGASHSLWMNPNTGVIEAVPRHKEIKEPLTKKNTSKYGCRLVLRPGGFEPYRDRSSASPSVRPLLRPTA